MKKIIMSQGKKLNKKELKTIRGGLKICILPGTTECSEYARYCGEPQCQVLSTEINNYQY